VWIAWGLIASLLVVSTPCAAFALPAESAQEMEICPESPDQDTERVLQEIERELRRAHYQDKVAYLKEQFGPNLTPESFAALVKDLYVTPFEFDRDSVEIITSPREQAAK